MTFKAALRRAVHEYQPTWIDQIRSGYLATAVISRVLVGMLMGLAIALITQ
jgi:hypothetical protein